LNQLQKIGICPYCDCSLILYESKDNSRYIKCEICGHAYNIPTRGEIIPLSFKCPLYGYPLIIIRTNESTQYYSDRICSKCPEYKTCEVIHNLIDNSESKTTLD